MRGFYLGSRFFIVVTALCVLFLIAFAEPTVLDFAKIGVLVLVGLAVLDTALLFARRGGATAARTMPERMSNGDPNDVDIVVRNGYGFATHVEVIDELPVQFQQRTMHERLLLGPGAETSVRYTVRPVERGEYNFGVINVFVASPLGLVRRRFRFDADRMVPVYPSYQQMRKYELLAVSNRLSSVGVKKVRRIGHTMEFDQIREYVRGDDYRTINWRATARTADLMVNQYQDEKAQQVYCVIDKGRTMKMPFEGMTLLDYAVNTSLVMANTALLKGDKAGLITFAERVNEILPADRRLSQMQNVLGTLYNQRTNFLESSFDTLYATIRQKVNSRSLLLLYTNFETLASLQRQLPYLRKIARDHLLVVVFFENTELTASLAKVPHTVEEIYMKTITEKFDFEKRLIVKELQRYGIASILTTPSALTVSSINKYLELKARRLI